ncbi:MAG: hypothetical protein ABSF91_01385 [Bacteroidota bacterium]|jgi:hypothetical protein
MKKKHLLFGILLLLVSQSLTGQTIVTRDSLIHRYNIMEENLRRYFLMNDTAYNFTGGYAWGVASLLQAEVIMYKATLNLTYLDSFGILADEVVIHRDDRMGLKDWQGKSGEGWSSRRHWDLKVAKNVDGGLPMRDLVEDAVMCSSLLSFSEVVMRDSVKLRYLMSKARQYLTEAEAVMKAHIADEWNEKTQHFYLPKGSPAWSDGVNVPHNYEAQAGSAFIQLNHLTHNDYYRRLAQTIATNLKRDLSVVGDAYLWYYWGGQGYSGWKKEENVSVNTVAFSGQKTVEDVGHGSLEVSFILDCVHEGIVFKEDDVHLLVNTFDRKINKQTYLAHDVAGNGGSKDEQWTAYRWLLLIEYDSSMYPVFYKFLYQGAKLPENFGSSYLVASLVKYHQK